MNSLLRRTDVEGSAQSRESSGVNVTNKDNFKDVAYTVLPATMYDLKLEIFNE